MNEETDKVIYKHGLSRKDREIERKRRSLEAKIAALQSEFESAEEELNKVYVEEELVKAVAQKTRQDMTKIRGGSDTENMNDTSID